MRCGDNVQLREPRHVIQISVNLCRCCWLLLFASILVRSTFDWHWQRHRNQKCRPTTMFELTVPEKNEDNINYFDSRWVLFHWRFWCVRAWVRVTETKSDDGNGDDDNAGFENVVYVTAATYSLARASSQVCGPPGNSRISTSLPDTASHRHLVHIWRKLTATIKCNSLLYFPLSLVTVRSEQTSCFSVYRVFCTEIIPVINAQVRFQRYL